VAGVMHCAEPSTGIDMYMGSGGAPEGVLAAAALKCMGGQMYGRLLFRNDDEKGRAKKAGITESQPRLHARRHGDEGRDLRRHRRVTDGSILPGIKREPGYLRPRRS
jgi:fructose-1,6-bisphosphatase II / sedoheptulose-1,7-bisphosphatase